MPEEYPITRQELENALVVTAPEIGFMFKDGWSPIRESWYTLAQVFALFSNKVKFILAQEEMPGSGTQSVVHLGIFYPFQSAAPSAHAFCQYIAWNTDKFPEIAKRSTELCFGTVPHAISVKRQSPVIEWTRLIGGGEIHKNQKEDKCHALTLDNNFWLLDVPPEYMEIVRQLVLEKLNVEDRT